MKKVAIVLAVIMLVAVFSFCLNANELTLESQQARNWRSADPCEIWRRWQEGPAKIITPQLRDGKASHMAPFYIAYYSSKENKMNQLLGFVVMEYLSDLNGIPLEAMLNPEGSIFHAMKYAIDQYGYTKYPGFYPQFVAATYQLDLARTRKETFMEAYEKHFSPDGKEKIRKIYVRYSWELSKITGYSYYWTNEEASEALDSVAVYDHFRGPEITPRVIELLLKRIHSPMADVSLFKRRPLDEAFYWNIQCPE